MPARTTSVVTTTCSLSTTCVCSLPFNQSYNYQNTFSYDLNKNSSSNEFNSSRRNNSSPALKYALISKKSSCYKGRKSSSQFSQPSTILNLTEEGLLDISNAASKSSLSSSDSSLSMSVCTNRSYSDTISLYSNSKSSIISTIDEICDNSHPLAEPIFDQVIDNLQYEDNLMIKNDGNENIEESENDVKISFFNNFKQQIKNSSLFLSVKMIYKNNEILFANEVNIIDIQNRDILMNDALPLETYRTTYKPINQHYNICSTNSSITIPKSRECRLNSSFLRFFAIDSSIKLNYSNELLDNSIVDSYQYEFLNSEYKSLDEFVNNQVDNIQSKHVLKFSLLSRDKLWTNVVLPPRNDIFCKNSDRNNNSNKNCLRKSLYIKVRNEPKVNGSLVRENGTAMPWINMDDCKTLTKGCFNPSGSLSNNIQYTVKDWENVRWSCVSYRD